MRRKHRTILRVAVVALAVVAGATADARRGRRASIDEFPGSWAPETSYKSMTSIDSENYGFNAGPIPLPTASHLDNDTTRPSYQMSPMKMKIGSKTYTHVWVNRNGYVSLVEDENGLPASFSPGLTSLSAVNGNVIAPFYSAIQLREIEDGCTNAPRNCIWDLSYSTLDLGVDLDSEQNVDYVLGFRATWGLFPMLYDDDQDPANALRPPGVARQGTAAGAPRNTFQIWLIDRQLAPGGHPGDFDLQINYDEVSWEEATTHVGVKTGPANTPEVLLDFAKFYTSFLDESPDISVANRAYCWGTATDPNNKAVNFDKVYPLGCNRITIEFRDGKPNLKTYTSDLSTALVAANGTLHAAVPYGMTLSITNGDYDPATNVTARVDLPAGATLVSTPATTCSQTGTVATCRLSGSLAAHATATVPVQISSNQSGRQDFRVRVDADQYDWDSTGNDKSMFVTVADSADLTITACTRPTSVAQGAAATVTCTVKNNGPQAAADFALEATVPNILTFSSGTGCTVTAGAMSCASASLASGASRDIGMTFNTPTAGTASLSMTVRSPTTFDPQANVATDASFVVTAPPPPPVTPPKKKKGGALSLEEMLGLMFGVALIARRRYRRQLDASDLRPRAAPAPGVRARVS